MAKEKVRSKILGLSDSFVKLYYDGRAGKREMKHARQAKRQDKPQVKLLWTQHCFFLFFFTPDSGYKQNQRKPVKKFLTEEKTALFSPSLLILQALLLTLYTLTVYIYLSFLQKKEGQGFKRLPTEHSIRADLFRADEEGQRKEKRGDRRRSLSFSLRSNHGVARFLPPLRRFLEGNNNHFYFTIPF